MTSPIATLLGVAWGAFVLVLAGRHRPVPVRVRTLTVGTAPADTRRRPRRLAVGDVTLAVGRLVGRRQDEARQRRLGGSVLAAAGAAALVPAAQVLAAVVAAVLAWWWPAHRRRRRARQRADDIARAVPDVVDLFLLAVDAGLTVPLALRAVARRTGADTALGAELGRAVVAIDLGRRTADVLDDLAAPDRAGDAVRPLVAALAASERYGAPLATSLVRLADDARRQRRRRAEEAARRLPVTLLFPLVTCTLPAFGLLTVGPLIASAVRSLRL
jgi:pilus assembly protein TadC